MSTWDSYMAPATIRNGESIWGNIFIAITASFIKDITKVQGSLTTESILPLAGQKNERREVKLCLVSDFDCYTLRNGALYQILALYHSD